MRRCDLVVRPLIDHEFRPAAAALFVTLSLVTACGSTAVPDGGPADGRGLDAPINRDATSLDTGSSGVGELGAPALGGVTQPGERSPGTTTSTHVDGTLPGPSGRGATTLHGPGVTAKTITVGQAYATDTEDFQRSLGNTAVSPGDHRAMAEAVVADINKHGGVAGRKLEVVFHAVRASDPSPAEAKEQATCAAFTQDHKVLAAFPMGSANGRACLGKAGAIAIAPTQGHLTRADFRNSPHYYDTSGVAVEDIATNLVDTWITSNYFSKWNTATGQPGIAPVEVGILAPDTNQWATAIPRVLLPELARHGIRVNPDNIVFWDFPESNQQTGNAVAQIQAAALKFRANGVTHFMPMEQNSAAFFGHTAESQNYRPRWGINTNSAIAFYAGSLIPYEQLNGATGLGYTPSIDLPASKNGDNSPYAGPGRKHCLSVLKAAGITFGNYSEEVNGLMVCDLYYSLRHVLGLIPANTPITARTFIRALEGVGRSFRIAALPDALYGPGRHYPVTRGWVLQYIASCQCTDYVGKSFILR